MFSQFHVSEAQPGDLMLHLGVSRRVLLVERLERQRWRVTFADGTQAEFRDRTMLWVETEPVIRDPSLIYKR